MLAAKEALCLNITPLRIPYTDLKRNINIYIRDKWQTLWNEFPQNKLYQIQPILVWANIIFGKKGRRNCASQGSYWAFVYDSFLLVKGDPMPEYIPCYCALTVKHILIECVDFIEVPHQYFDVPDLKTLFMDVDPSQIFAFLEAIGVFKKLYKLHLLMLNLVTVIYCCFYL